MKVLKIWGIVLVLCMLIPLDLHAASQETAVLEVKDHQVITSLTQLDQKEEIRSLQLSFQIKAVKGSIEEKDIRFQFDDVLSSEVKEYRYHHDTGVLTIYLSGTVDLYTNEVLSLGALQIDKNSDALVEVSVIDQSFLKIEESKFKNQGMLIQSTEAVRVATGSMIEKEEQPDDTNTEEPKEDIEDNDQDKNQDKDVDDTKDKADNMQPEQNENQEIKEESSTSKEKDPVSAPTGDTTNISFYVSSIFVALLLMGILIKVYQNKKRQ